MTSCFTNKYIAGKLNRYYYYRCTATMKQDWQACSVKQVSAERLEDFCLENLERISVDKNYIENLVFRLNSDIQAGHRAGYELTDGCSKFSIESIKIRFISCQRDGEAVAKRSPAPPLAGPGEGPSRLQKPTSHRIFWRRRPDEI